MKIVDTRVEAAILNALEPGTEERFVLRDTRIITATLRRVVETPAAIDEVSRMLALAAALRNELCSPGAADALVALIRADPTARSLVERQILRVGGLDEKRGFEAREGRLSALRAPLLEDQRGSGLRARHLQQEDLKWLTR